MAMYGADIAQLRTLAQQFDRHAQQLDAHRMTVGSAIQISAWLGPVAVRFRHLWDSDYSRRVHSAAETLRSAANDLRRNADEQDRASAAQGRAIGGGSARGLVGIPGSVGSFVQDVVIDGSKSFSDVVDMAGSVVSNVTGKDFDVWKVVPHGSYISSALKGIGLGDDAARLALAVREGDWSGAMLTAADGAFSFTPSPISMLWGGMKEMTGFFIPLDQASRDEHMAWMEGRGYSESEIATRYSGLQGFINLGNDNVERKAPWMNRIAETAMQGPADWLLSMGIKVY
ncbi:hypothetical protein [Microbacterium capsulatum]|uniref:WXG100 family type VII secretion target n=1 Tax=Microbacterium capsulatum TaxID=3041921 RepID=A0ABU0XEA7_9MICO|nr:hypothetical protein [Microbacterium sp. ASV81]MDQ4213452.1 hypothetical protein [Microbacterium sp. ASV81]